MKVRVLDHPLVQHKLTRMRARDCPSPEFRRLLRQIGGLLAFDATLDLETTLHPVETPVAPTQGPRLAGRPPVVAPVLRAGLGLADGMLDLFSEADVAHIGLRRDEETLRSEVYFMKAPAALEERVVIVVDPMLATGNSAVSALALLDQAGARDLRFACLVAAPEGIETVQKAFPEVPILTAAIDERLDERAYIVPGLGDAGDRLFGT